MQPSASTPGMREAMNFQSSTVLGSEIDYQIPFNVVDSFEVGVLGDDPGEYFDVLFAPVFLYPFIFDHPTHEIFYTFQSYF